MHLYGARQVPVWSDLSGILARIPGCEAVLAGGGPKRFLHWETPASPKQAQHDRNSEEEWRPLREGGPLVGGALPLHLVHPFGPLHHRRLGVEAEDEVRFPALAVEVGCQREVRVPAHANPLDVPRDECDGPVDHACLGSSASRSTNEPTRERPPPFPPYRSSLRVRLTLDLISASSQLSPPVASPFASLQHSAETTATPDGSPT